MIKVMYIRGIGKEIVDEDDDDDDIDSIKSARRWMLSLLD